MIASDMRATMGALGVPGEMVKTCRGDWIFLGFLLGQFLFESPDGTQIAKAVEIDEVVNIEVIEKRSSSQRVAQSLSPDRL